MSRAGISGTVDAALAAEHVPLICFIELQFASGTVRVCNAGYDFTWNGFTWLGAGNVGAIQPIQEGAELQMYGLSMQLSGVNVGLVASALGEQYQGRAAKLWVAPLDANYNVLVDPVGPFQFRMDTMSIEMGDTATITLTAESRLADWDRPRVRRYTSEDQALLYPDDKFFDFVPDVQSMQILF